MNNRIAIFRRLIAKYWQPFVLLGSAFTVVLNLLKLAQDAGLKIPIDKLPVAGRIVGTTQEQIILRVAIFVGLFILIRFPGIAIFITRMIEKSEKSDIGEIGGIVKAEQSFGNKIFISYRRADSIYITGRIRERLSHNFVKNSIFMDIDSVPLGVDFRHM